MISAALTLAAVLTTTSMALPGGAPISTDYLVYDAGNQRVWVPAGNTGNVDVVDVVSGKVTAIGGFATRPSPRPNRPPMGPSSATVGDGVVWVGSRGDDKICAFDGKTLEKRSCVELAAMPDGVQWVAATRELWVTVPRAKALAIVPLGAKAVAPLMVPLPGEPEGYAVDEARGVFYTNLEDANKTLAIDVKTHKILSTWATGCGGDGPRGLALDGARQLLMVACTDGAVTLDVAHGGKQVGRLATGKGVDNIEYLAAQQRLYVASGQDGRLTVASVADGGALAVVATAATAKGARNAVVDSAGNAYLVDGASGKLLVVKAR